MGAESPLRRRRARRGCLALVQALPPATGEPGSAGALMRASAREAMLARLQAEIEEYAAQAGS